MEKGRAQFGVPLCAGGGDPAGKSALGTGEEQPKGDKQDPLDLWLGCEINSLLMA